MKVKQAFCTIASIINVVVAIFFATLSLVLTLGFATDLLPASVFEIYQNYFQNLDVFTKYLFSFWVVIALFAYLPTLLLFVSNVCLLKKKPCLKQGNVIGFVGILLSGAVLYVTQEAWTIENIHYLPWIICCSIGLSAFLLFISLFLPSKAKQPKMVEQEQDQVVEEVATQEVVEVEVEVQPQKEEQAEVQTEEKEEIYLFQEQPDQQEIVAPQQTEQEVVEEKSYTRRASKKETKQPVQKDKEQPQPVFDTIIQPKEEVHSDDPVKFEVQDNLSVAQVVDSTYGNSPNYNGDKLRYIDDVTTKQLERVKRLFDVGVITESEYTALIMSFLSDKKS